MKLLSLILLAMVGGGSLISFVLCAVDKCAAKAERRRIPEKRFFWVALLGGGPGLWLGMRCFHHKTLHRSFWLAAVGTTLLYGAALLWIALRMGGML